MPAAALHKCNVYILRNVVEQWHMGLIGGSGHTPTAGPPAESSPTGSLPHWQSQSNAFLVINYYEYSLNTVVNVDPKPSQYKRSSVRSSFLPVTRSELEGTLCCGPSQAVTQLKQGSATLTL